MKAVKGLLQGSRLNVWIATGGDKPELKTITVEYQRTNNFLEQDPYDDFGRNEKIYYDWSDFGETKEEAIFCRINSLKNQKKALENEIKHWESQLPSE